MIRHQVKIVIFWQTLFLCSVGMAMWPSPSHGDPGNGDPGKGLDKATINEKLAIMKAARKAAALLERRAEARRTKLSEEKARIDELASCIFNLKDIDSATHSYAWMVRDEQGEIFTGKALEQGRLLRLYAIRLGLIRYLHLIKNDFECDTGLQYPMAHLVTLYYENSIPFPYGIPECGWLVSEESALDPHRYARDGMDPKSPPRKKQRV